MGEERLQEEIRWCRCGAARDCAGGGVGGLDGRDCRCRVSLACGALAGAVHIGLSAAGERRRTVIVTVVEVVVVSVVTRATPGIVTVVDEAITQLQAPETAVGSARLARPQEDATNSRGFRGAATRAAMVCGHVAFVELVTCQE